MKALVFFIVDVAVPTSIGAITLDTSGTLTWHVLAVTLISAAYGLFSFCRKQKPSLWLLLKLGG